MIARRPHGTHARYRSGCHCEECRAAAAAYERARRRGELLMRDADEAREHVLRLIDHGMSCQGIATAAGVAFNSVARLAAGERQRMRHDTAEAILAVRVDDFHHGHRQPAENARRLLEAMYAAGYSKMDVARMIGWKWMYVARDGDEWVMSKTMRKLTVLYRLLARRGLVPADVLDAIESKS